MNLIISSVLKDTYNNFKVVATFKEAMELNGVDVLIIHKLSESDFDTGIYLTKLHNEKNVASYFYICETPSVMIDIIVKGYAGLVFRDEFYFEDEEELAILVKENSVSTDGKNELVIASEQVLRDFIQAFARGDVKIQTPAYLSQVNQAINQLTEITYTQEQQIAKMGISTVDIFQKASSLIKDVYQKNTFLEQKLDDLANSTANTSSGKATFGNNVVIFPTYNYMNTSKVVLIKELSPCRYLTSLVLGYKHHLHYDLNKRVKLIFVHQKGAGVSQKYYNFTSITQDNCEMKTLYDADEIATNNPKKDVLRELFSKKEEIYIIVDRLYSGQDIVGGKIYKINAVSGMSDLDRFKVNASDCIFSTYCVGDNLGIIPTIKDYSREVDSRYAAYAQVCSALYERIDRRIGATDTI